VTPGHGEPTSARRRWRSGSWCRDLAGAGLSEVVTPALVSPDRGTSCSGGRVPSGAGAPHPGASRSRSRTPVARPLAPAAEPHREPAGGGRHEPAARLRGPGGSRSQGVCPDRRHPAEWWRLGIALTGAAEPVAWNRPARPYDLDDAKASRASSAARGPGACYEPRPGATVPPGPDRRGAAGGACRDRRRAAPGGPEASDSPCGRVLLAEVRSTAWPAAARPEHAPRWAASPRRAGPGDHHPERTPAATIETLVVANAGALLRDFRCRRLPRRPAGDDEKRLAYRLRFGAPDRTLTEPGGRGPRSRPWSRRSSRPARGSGPERAGTGSDPPGIGWSWDVRPIASVERPLLGFPGDPADRGPAAVVEGCVGERG